MKYIEPFHYEEIVEERFLSRLCGYALCRNEIKIVNLLLLNFSIILISIKLLILEINEAHKRLFIANI